MIYCILPTISSPLNHGTPDSACVDVPAAQDVTILPGRGVWVETDLTLIPPKMTIFRRVVLKLIRWLGFVPVLRFYERSGLKKHHLSGGAGVVDFDYRGPLKVWLFNHGNRNYEVRKGDRISQACWHLILRPKGGIAISTVRGEGGFGSTGK